MEEAEDTLRAIGAGEIDAFVVSAAGRERVFALTTADRPYRIFVEHMQDGAATVSSNGVVLYANRRLAELVGLPRDALAGSKLSSFISGDTSRLERLFGQGPLDPTLELDLVADDGSAVPVLVGISPLDVDGDQLTCLTFTDLTSQRASDREIARLGRAQDARMAELQEAQVALTEQATHDALTGLPNRALFIDRVDQAIAQSDRSGRCTIVFFVDLDGFKQVNDAQGHAAGDAVLQRVAQGLLTILRPMDTVARLGGDEFVVLAPDVDSRSHAQEIGMRVSSQLAAWLDGGATSAHVTASVGIAVSVAGRGTAELLLGEADRAMYEAKSRGGARVEVFDAALSREVEARTAAELMIHTALDERRIAVRYQPIVDLASNSIAGFEALARIVKPDGTLLAPDAFIPVAEESGLVVQLGAQVLHSACTEAGGWQVAAASSCEVSVAVNLSPRQFDSGNLMANLLATLERTGLNPARLHLEITETAIIDLSPDLLRQLGQIRELGLQIGLDDFGTGYASLTHLRRLPLTFVKIDRSFVGGLLANRDDERIVSAVIDLSANLGLRSVAEGVETLEQLDRLRVLGCEQAQGFIFTEPLPAKEINPAIQNPDILAIAAPMPRADAEA